MIARTHIPGPPLSEFVELLWLSEGCEVPHAKERVLPDGSMQLIINLRDNGFRVYDRAGHDCELALSPSIVTGPRAEFVVINAADVTSTIGVHFKPGGAKPFFQVPPDELSDHDVDLDVLWGASAASELRERILDARPTDAKFRILEEALVAHACWNAAQHPAVAFGLRRFDIVPHMGTIGDVTAQIGLSRRRFIELFHEAVGLTPKRFCRVRRFQEVLRGAFRAEPIDWTDVASACGYFDQAHLIHDFRAFSGLTPSEYAQRRTVYQNHVRLT